MLNTSAQTWRKTKDTNVILSAQDDVIGFDVAVNNAFAVDEGDRAEQIHNHQLNSLLTLCALLLHLLRDRLAINPLLNQGKLLSL